MTAGPGPRESSDQQDLNRWPVSVAARLMLIEAGATPDPESPYIFQLVLWALRTGQAEAEPDILETFNAMPGWRTERITNFLMLGEGHDEYEPPGWRDAGDPLSLARLLIADMEEKMMVHFPWYYSLS